MIIACPECSTRYVVPESAIGADGRTVRCAKCKHSWFQAPPPLDLTDRAEPGAAAAVTTPASPPPPPPVPSQPEPPAPEPSAPPPSQAPEKAAEPSISHWRTEDRPKSTATPAAPEPTAAPEPKEAPAPEAETAEESDADAPGIDPDNDPLAGELNDDLADDADYDFDDGEFEYDPTESRFDYSPPFSQRRNSLKMWTIAAGVFALFASGTAVAVNYYGLPDWLPITQPTFGIGRADLALDFPADQQRKETLESGEEIFRVRGSISNTGQQSVTVPSLLIVFRDAREKNVYSWVVVPSKRELAPGESLNVTEAVTDIPLSAQAAEIGWSPG